MPKKVNGSPNKKYKNRTKPMFCGAGVSDANTDGFIVAIDLRFVCRSGVAINAGTGLSNSNSAAGVSSPVTVIAWGFASIRGPLDWTSSFFAADDDDDADV